MADNNATLSIVDQILKDNAAKLSEYEQSYNAIQPQSEKPESEKISKQSSLKDQPQQLYQYQNSQLDLGPDPYVPVQQPNYPQVSAPAIVDNVGLSNSERNRNRQSLADLQAAEPNVDETEMNQTIKDTAAVAVQKANARKDVELNEPTDTRKERFDQQKWLYWDGQLGFFGKNEVALPRLKGNPDPVGEEKQPPKWNDRFKSWKWYMLSFGLYFVIFTILVPQVQLLGTLKWQEFDIVYTNSIAFPIKQTFPFTGTMQVDEQTIVDAMKSNADENNLYQDFPNYWHTVDGKTQYNLKWHEREDVFNYFCANTKVSVFEQTLVSTNTTIIETQTWYNADCNYVNTTDSVTNLVRPVFLFQMAAGENYDKFGPSTQKVLTSNIVDGKFGNPVETNPVPEAKKNITFVKDLNDNNKYRIQIVFDKEKLKGSKVQDINLWRSKNSSTPVLTTGDDNGFLKFKLPENNVKQINGRGQKWTVSDSPGLTKNIKVELEKDNFIYTAGDTFIGITVSYVNKTKEINIFEELDTRCTTAACDTYLTFDLAINYDLRVTNSKYFSFIDIFETLGGLQSFFLLIGAWLLPGITAGFFYKLAQIIKVSNTSEYIKEYIAVGPAYNPDFNVGRTKEYLTDKNQEEQVQILKDQNEIYVVKSDKWTQPIDKQKLEFLQTNASQTKIGIIGLLKKRINFFTIFRLFDEQLMDMQEINGLKATIQIQEEVNQRQEEVNARQVVEMKKQSNQIKLIQEKLDIIAS